MSRETRRSWILFCFFFFFPSRCLSYRQFLAFLLPVRVRFVVTSSSVRSESEVKDDEIKDGEEEDRREGGVESVAYRGEIARILERQGDGRRGDARRRGREDRTTRGRERETADDAKIERRSRFLGNRRAKARALQSASARSIFRIRLGRARFTAPCRPLRVACGRVKKTCFLRAERTRRTRLRTRVGAIDGSRRKRSVRDSTSWKTPPGTEQSHAGQASRYARGG